MTELPHGEQLNIHVACRLGNLGLIVQLVEADPTCVNSRDAKLHWTPLFRCVVSRNFQAIEYLLSKGADPNIANENNETPLHQAADNAQLDIARLLLRHSASPNIQEEYGETPLHLAVNMQDLAMTELLLQFQAKPSLANYTLQRTPLHYAAQTESEPLVRLLLAHGANPQSVDKHGKTPAALAADENLKELLLSQATDHSTLEVTEKKVSSKGIQRGKLFYWLEMMGLDSHYELLVNNGYDNLDELVQQMKTPLPLSSQELESIGIARAGERYRILIQLSHEAAAKKRVATHNHSKSCCFDCRGKPSDLSLERWLDAHGLCALAAVLNEAGYDKQLLLDQATSPYKFTHFILKKELKVQEREDRERLLAAIKKAKDPAGSGSHLGCHNCCIM